MTPLIMSSLVSFEDICFWSTFPVRGEGNELRLPGTYFHAIANLEMLL